MVDILTDKGIIQTLSAEMLKDLAEFWQTRQDHLTEKDLTEISEEYKMTAEIANIKYHLLIEGLGEANLKHFVDFYDAQSTMDSISRSISYKKGFCDGIKSLLQILLL